MRFRFIDAERAGLAMPIFRLCRLLQVSVSGFYAWRNRGPSQRQLDDMVLLAHVRAAFRRSRESYGAERVHHELAENGIEVGRHRVARLMRGNGLSPKRKQKFKKTTDSQHNKAVASNLLDQNFSAEAPNEKWAADISYIWTAQGWLYLAVMLDLYSRRVIGWAVGARMTSDLPLRALNRAIGLRQPGAGVIHHSDRGSQGEFNRSSQHSGIGGCYDGTQTAVGSVWTEQVAFARSTGLGTAWGACSVLGSDCDGAFERGRGPRCRCIPSGRLEVVPEVWRHATITFIAIGQAAVRTLPVFRGT